MNWQGLLNWHNGKPKKNLIIELLANWTTKPRAALSKYSVPAETQFYFFWDETTSKWNKVNFLRGSSFIVEASSKLNMPLISFFQNVEWRISELNCRPDSNEHPFDGLALFQLSSAKLAIFWRQDFSSKWGFIDILKHFSVPRSGASSRFSPEHIS